MKKTTRILAVLMTVCLLFGVVCAFASSAKVASEKREKDLFVVQEYTSAGTMSTTVERYWATFDNDVLPATLTEITVTKGTESHVYYDSMAYAGSKTQRFAIKAGTAGKAYPAGLFVDKAADGEGYLAMRKVPGAFRVTDDSGNLVTDLTFSNKTAKLDAPEWYLALSHSTRNIAGANDSSQHLNLVDYATADFDYGTDRWAYKVNGVWETGTTVPSDADPASVRPANMTGTIALAPSTLNGTAYKTQRDTGLFSVSVCQDSETGLFFVSNVDAPAEDTEYTEGVDMWLSNQPGVLDHFTFVLDVTAGTDGVITKVDAHIYVNGIYLCTDSATPNGYDDMVLYGVYVRPTGLAAKAEDGITVVKEHDCYSLVFDNIVPNYYKLPQDADNPGYVYYDSADGKYGLDDFFASESVYKATNLAACPDTLYGIYEQRDNAIVIIDGVKHKVVGNTVDLGGMIPNEAKVTLPAGKKFTATPAESVESFDVTLGEGSKFELVDASYKFAALDADTNTYTVSKIATKASLTLLLKMDFNFYVPADTPFVDFFGIDITGPVDVTEGGVDYKQFTWTPEIDSFETNTVTLYYDADKTLACTTVLDVLKYASDVAAEYECSSAASTLVYQTMKYKVNVASYTDESFNANSVPAIAAFFDLYDAHASGCTCKDTCEDGIPADSVSKGTLEGLRISYMLDISEAGLVIDGAGATDALTVTYNNGTSDVTLTVGNGIRRTASGNSVYYVVDGISIEFINSVLTVTNGTQSGTCSLYAHMQALNAAEKHTAGSVAAALYAYSVAARAYVNSLTAN